MPILALKGSVLSNLLRPWLGRATGKTAIQRNALFSQSTTACQRRQSSGTSTLAQILIQVQDGKLNAVDAAKIIQGASQTNDQLLESFANLDHGRSKRTGFPEAVFAEGKTISQVASILDDMAWNVNESLREEEADAVSIGNAILATR